MPAAQHDALTPRLIGSPVWDDRMVHEAGIPVFDTPLVSVGGGFGSFTLVDVLRICGVPTSSIRVVSNSDTPWQTWEYLTRVSQLPPQERIRSDAGARPDNIWGFPSYALHEALQDRSPRLLWHVLVEPLLTDFFSPRAATVFATVKREADRIAYWDMLVKGQVRMVRRRAGGGYFTLFTPPAGTGPGRRVACRSRYVHLAVGYPGLKFLEDLQCFREEYDDYHRVVNAYEPHEHVYEFLKTRPGTVVVRGAGIVASRVLQRLMDDRERYGLQTQIVHLFRTFVAGPHGAGPWMRRDGGDGWAYQAFTFPKSAFGGQLKERFRQARGEERTALYKTVGGTTTPKLRRWQEQLRQGRAGGWYRPLQATVHKVEPTPDGRLASFTSSADGVSGRHVSDFVIDCTGLEADMPEHRVLADLLEHGGARRNGAGRLTVGESFEVTGTENGDGVLYASGAATAGNHFPAVDSFLGMQTAALDIAADLARRGFCARLTSARSVGQWLRWAAGRPPV
ncbi:hypothetical protein [Planomonospora parontospora]|uniref:hypothetical protein n=1 Tax=Planomonospora parontospora TaxID=58119 RepID=UPI00194520F7|nr:hypothetical protein [Planomonospora parontospora]GGL40707.1 hypothetical protein GCM10014719_47370 [Planomonospora parontospora subsp. antibiotica]GII18230.1 hypothetical protein Ppa05_49560 [Planomonospora parontospora subsp. antibiotica]